MPAMSTRTKVRRAPARAVYDRDAIDAILDEALIAHLGFVDDGQPYVIPTLQARIGDTVYIHGSSASRAIRTLGAGIPACLTVTLVDGLVLARSAFHHSINYRSVVVLGTCTAVEGPEQREVALRAFTERLVPGRWDDARLPNRQELKATAVVAIPLDGASAKVRVGPPKDDEEDLDLPVWAGVVPLRQVVGDPLADAALPADVPLPTYLNDFIERRRG
jgi:uncharacterized protein